MPAAEAFRTPQMRQSAEIVAASTASALQAKYTPCSFACWDKDSVKNGPGTNFQGGSGDLSIASNGFGGSP